MVNVIDSNLISIINDDVSSSSSLLLSNTNNGVSSSTSTSFLQAPLVQDNRSGLSSPNSQMSSSSASSVCSLSSHMSINNACSPPPPPPHYYYQENNAVYVYVTQGQIFQFKVGHEMRTIHGPATIKMTSNDAQPIPFHLQAPVGGHLVQHNLNNNHILLSQPTQQYQRQCQSLNISIPPPPPPPPPTSKHLIQDLILKKNTTKFKHNDTSSHLNNNNNNNNNNNKKKFHSIHNLKIKNEFNLHDEEKLKKSKSTHDMDCETRLRQELSKIRPAEIISVEAKSAQVRIVQPDITLACADTLMYTLEINETHRINCGDANEIQIEDLKPSCDYSLRVYAMLNGLCGEPSSPISFKTKSCEPDRPAPPKEITGTRKKNEITLRWNATNENGSKLLHYILECDFCGTFSEIYRGTQKQFSLKKLQPSTAYSFRLAAENSIGLSAFSDVVTYYTAGCVPQVPSQPRCTQITAHSFTFEWTKSSDTDEIELQMQEASHFFIIYNGTECTHTIDNLKSNFKYNFRMRARNQEGHSPFTDIFTHTTYPDRPMSPSNLRLLKLTLTPYSCKLTWDSPVLTGGSSILNYMLELKNCVHNQVDVFSNVHENEFTCDNLRPGCLYEARVSCANEIGSSGYSPKCPFTTPPVVPGQCETPRINGKIKSNSICLKWSEPNFNGGASIVDYELRMCENADKLNGKIVYKGHDLECVVASLVPAQFYSFCVRASNKCGYGEWSDSLTITSGPSIPDAPLAPSLTTKSYHCVLISWLEPLKTNGACIQEYKLEYSLRENEGFVQIYEGDAKSYELKSLLPNTYYYFRVQANNCAGWSAWSHVSNCLTPPSVPSQVQNIKISNVESTSVCLSWKIPCCHGCPLISYLIDLGENRHQSFMITNSELCEYKLENLQPDTLYKLRIQATNAIGSGQYSIPIKFQTKVLPPQTPRLECTSFTHNSLKIKFSDAKQIDYSLVYTLEMKQKIFNVDDVCFKEVFRGSALNFKLTKLNESCTYVLRVCATNESGTSEWSPEYEYKTLKSPPLQPRCPLISDLTPNSCLVEWNRIRIGSCDESEDRVEYVLQIQNGLMSDFKEIYRGESTSFRLYDLTLACEYNVRVAAVRVCHEDASRVQSSFSGCTLIKTYHVKELNKNDAETCNKTSSLSRVTKSRPLTDHEWAALLLTIFALGAILFAYIAHWYFSA